MLSFKQIVKKIPPFMSFYASFKAHQHHGKNERLEKEYGRRAAQKGIQYSEKLVEELYFKRIEARGVVAPKRRIKDKPLRIFYFGANEPQDRSGFLQALEKFGRVYLFTNSKGGYGPLYWYGKIDHTVRKDNTDRFRTLYSEALKEGPIDLVIGQMWANYLDVSALQECQAKGAIVINIAMDDRGVPELWEVQDGVLLGAIGLADGCDLVLNTSPECCIRFLLKDCACLFWPLASDPTLFSPAPEKDIQVSFVGSRYGIRTKYIEKIRKAGIPISVYGPGWENGPVDAKKASEIFGRSKVILGIGAVGYTDDILTMKLRDFDAPMAGAAYLTARNPDLIPFLEEDKEVVFYSTVEEAIEKLKALLANPSKISSISEAAHQRARRDHTWDQRLTTTFRDYQLIE